MYVSNDLQWVSVYTPTPCAQCTHMLHAVSCLGTHKMCIYVWYHVICVYHIVPFAHIFSGTSCVSAFLHRCICVFMYMIILIHGHAYIISRLYVYMISHHVCLHMYVCYIACLYLTFFEIWLVKAFHVHLLWVCDCVICIFTLYIYI